MKLHLGALKNPVRVVTRVGGYRFKAHDAPEQYVEWPAEIVRPVRRMFGLSAAKWFVGVMICEKSAMVTASGHGTASNAPPRAASSSSTHGTRTMPTWRSISALMGLRLGAKQQNERSARLLGQA